MIIELNIFQKTNLLQFLNRIGTNQGIQGIEEAFAFCELIRLIQNAQETSPESSPKSKDQHKPTTTTEKALPASQG